MAFSSRRKKKANEHNTGICLCTSYRKQFISSINYIMSLVVHGTDYAHEGFSFKKIYMYLGYELKPPFPLLSYFHIN